MAIFLKVPIARTPFIISMRCMADQLRIYYQIYLINDQYYQAP
jgi:hypothetical protein